MGRFGRVVAWVLFAAIWGGPARGADIELPAPNSPDEPLAAEFSRTKAADFLDAVALDWTRKRQCGTCHTNYAYLMASPSLREMQSPATTEIRAFFENRVTHWDDSEKAAKPRWDAEVIATAAALAFHDAGTTGQLHPLTRKALDRMWTLQRPDGSWNWLKCNWPPYEHDDYYGAVLAALAVAKAPGDYARAESAREGLDRLRSYLRSTPAPDLHHKTLLLWASLKVDGLMTSSERDQTIHELLERQRPDGGWNLPGLGQWKRRDGTPNDPESLSDGYGTGLVIYILRQAGIPASNPALQRGVSWLKTHQRASGRWFTRSLNNDKFHYITHAGTGFAVLALQACETPEH